VWDRCGGPDVSKEERTDHDKAPYLVDYTRKTSFDSASESSDADSESAVHHLSFIDEEDDDIDLKQQQHSTAADDTDSDDDDDEDPISQIVSQKTPTRITIKLHVTDKTSSSWDSVRNHFTTL